MWLIYTEYHGHYSILMIKTYNVWWKHQLQFGMRSLRMLDSAELVWCSPPLAIDPLIYIAHSDNQSSWFTNPQPSKSLIQLFNCLHKEIDQLFSMTNVSSCVYYIVWVNIKGRDICPKLKPSFFWCGGRYIVMRGGVKYI